MAHLANNNKSSDSQHSVCLVPDIRMRLRKTIRLFIIK